MNTLLTEHELAARQKRSVKTNRNQRVAGTGLRYVPLRKELQQKYPQQFGVGCLDKIAKPRSNDTPRKKKADGPSFRERSAATIPVVSVTKLADSLDKLARVVAASEQRNEDVKRKAIAESCVWSVCLQKSKPLWQGFIAEPRWLSAGGARPKEEHRSEALRFVLRWTFGLTGNVTDTANFYYRAVAPLLAEGIPPKTVAAEIKRRGGLKKLAEAHAKPKMPKVIDERIDAASRSGPKGLAEAQAKPKLPKAIAEQANTALRRGPKRLAEAKAKREMPKVVDEQAKTAPTRRAPKDAVVLTIQAQLDDAAAAKLFRVASGSKVNLSVTLDAVGKVINLTIHDVANVKSDRW